MPIRQRCSAVVRIARAETKRPLFVKLSPMLADIATRREDAPSMPARMVSRSSIRFPVSRSTWSGAGQCLASVPAA